MKDFSGRIAVVTGGGSGIGRELVRALAAAGCNVAMCDVSAGAMEETISACEADRRPGDVRIIAHVADVSNEADVLRFRDDIGARMNTNCVHLLFNNAGIGAGASMFTDSRANWDRTFNVCWFGVYYMVRAFLPMMVKAQTAYSAAKFAVKGFTEALITDLRVNAPHIKCSVVMPGHIGTNFVANTRMVLAGRDGAGPTRKDSDRTLAASRAFIAAAPMTAAEAAGVILDAVREERWRVLVGEDAHRIDALVRADPGRVYDADFNALAP